MIIPKYKFLQRFPQAKRIAIRAAIPTDPVIEDMQELFNAATEIDLALQENIDAINYLVSVRLLTQSEADAILAAE